MPITAILIQSLLTLIVLLTSWVSWKSYKRTHDKANQILALSFLFLSSHLFVYLLAIYLYSIKQDSEVLRGFLTLSRILLSVGILIFAQSPIFLAVPFYCKYRNMFNTLFFLLILIFSFLHLREDPLVYVTQNGFVVGDIQTLIVKIMASIIPVSTGIIWCIGLVILTPKIASSFFKGRMIALGAGVILAVTGNVLYIFSNGQLQSAHGIGTIFVGYIFLLFALSAPSIRRLISSSPI